MRGRVTLKPISVINDNTHPETYLVPKITTEKAHKDLKQPQKWAKKLIWRNTHSTPKKKNPIQKHQPRKSLMDLQQQKYQVKHKTTKEHKYNPKRNKRKHNNDHIPSVHK